MNPPMLMHFDAAPVSAPVRQMAPKMAPKTAPVLTESVSVTMLPSQSKTHLLKDSAGWGWSEIRDYVVSAIEARFGSFPRDARKEAAIFKRFALQYGSDAGRIAQYAFETCDGWWMNSPVSVQRFCRGSDLYFASPILARLSD